MLVDKLFHEAEGLIILDEILLFFWNWRRTRKN